MPYFETRITFDNTSIKAALGPEILNWKLDITAISAETQPETEQIPIEESELNDADKQTLDEDAMQRVGALYYDEETGMYYAVMGEQG